MPLEPQDREVHDTTVSDQDAGVRSVYLRRNDFEKHGWTPGCTKCRFMVLHPRREGGPIHSNKCKSRMKEALQGTAEGRMRIEQAERRQTDYIARGIERSEASMDGGGAVHSGQNDRESRLDHSVGEGAQMRHEDEMEIDKQQSAGDSGEAKLYDMFVGATSESDTLGAVAEEVNAVNRDIMHLAMRMGVDPRVYGPQLRSEMANIIVWEHGDVGEESERVGVDREDSAPGGALAVEELMMMKENKPGEVQETKTKIRLSVT